MLYYIDYTQVRRNLEQAKTIVEALIKVLLLKCELSGVTSNDSVFIATYCLCIMQREEKKRAVMEAEVELQVNQMKYKVFFGSSVIFLFILLAVETPTPPKRWEKVAVILEMYPI